MVFCYKYSNMSSYKHLLTLMAGGEFSFRIYSRSAWSPRPPSLFEAKSIVDFI